MNEKMLPHTENLQILKIKTEYGSLVSMIIINLLNYYFLLKAIMGKNTGINLVLFTLFLFVFNLVYIWEGGIFLIEAICYDRNRNQIYILHQGCYPKNKLNIRYYGIQWHLSNTYLSDEFQIKRTKKKTYIVLGATSFKTEISISKARDKLVFGDGGENV